MSQLLIQDITVSNLGAGQTATATNLLVDHNGPVAATDVRPDRNTTITVVSATTATITFRNDGTAAATAVFRAAHIHSIQAQDSLAQLLWNGSAGSGGVASMSIASVNDPGAGVPYAAGAAGVWKIVQANVKVTAAGAAATLSFQQETGVGTGVYASVAGGAIENTTLGSETIGVVSFTIQPQRRYQYVLTGAGADGFPLNQTELSFQT